MAENRSLPPTYWPVARLRAAYSGGELSPVEVAEQALERAHAFNPALNAYLEITAPLAREQALAAERAYRAGSAASLAGIPVSIKDTFDIAGHVSTYGSVLYRTNRAFHDSGAVRRLRAAGAVFVGKTNTAEFAQSATTENLLGEPCRNPWDVSRTPGGSSGGATASVASGTATLALGADGGGSIRIPASFTGLVGFKPTYGLCSDEGGFRAMSDFACPGPLAWRVEDARAMLGVLAGRSFERSRVPGSLRVAWLPGPEGHPVDDRVLAAVRAAVGRIEQLGHAVEEPSLDLSGWKDAFAPLVLEDERRERGHLLAQRASLTDYELKSLEAAAELDERTVAHAREVLAAYRSRIEGFLGQYDLIVTPTTSVPAFPIDERPRAIAGVPVGWLWGAFPFTAAFNVAGTPGVSLPCGHADGLPVGVQIISARKRDDLLLDFAEELENALAFDAAAVKAKWASVQLEKGVVL